jgi:gliding motility-associated-like protein
MSIYDRWGNMVYQTLDINKGWDGKIKGNVLAEFGTYVYKIRVKDYMNREKTYVGHVIVM